MNKTKILSIALLFISTLASAQADLVVGTGFQLNVQRQNGHGDAFLLHNARYNSGDDLLQWETAHSTFGSRGIRFHYNGGIYFYANNSATVAGSTFTPVTRFFISNAGNIGIGNTAPADKLHISGNVVLDNGTVPSIATGTGASELGRYLRVTNSPTLATPSGLKAGGVLVADDFNYAAPAKNDLVIKGRVGIGTVIPTGNSHALSINGTVNATGLYVNNQLFVSSQWATSGSTIAYTTGAVGIGTTLTSNPNNYMLAVNGKINSTGGLYVNDQLFISSQWTTAGSAIYHNGAVGIGTALGSNPNNYTLAVNGKIGAKDVHVEKSSSTWPDYVFEKDYTLPTLNEVENFITTNKHLQDVPASKEVGEKGYNVSDMDAVLLKKIEELTLYIIQQQKEIDVLKEKIKQ